MTRLQEFIEAVYAAGWQAPNDAQWDGIEKVYLEYVENRDLEQKLEKCKEVLKGYANIGVINDPRGHKARTLLKELEE